MLKLAENIPCYKLHTWLLISFAVRAKCMIPISTDLPQTVEHEYPVVQQVTTHAPQQFAQRLAPNPNADLIDHPSCNSGQFLQPGLPVLYDVREQPSVSSSVYARPRPLTFGPAFQPAYSKINLPYAVVPNYNQQQIAPVMISGMTPAPNSMVVGVPVTSTVGPSAQLQWQTPHFYHSILPPGSNYGLLPSVQHTWEGGSNSFGVHPMHLSAPNGPRLAQAMSQPPSDVGTLGILQQISTFPEALNKHSITEKTEENESASLERMLRLKNAEPYIPLKRANPDATHSDKSDPKAPETATLVRSNQETLSANIKHDMEPQLSSSQDISELAKQPLTTQEGRNEGSIEPKGNSATRKLKQILGLPVESGTPEPKNVIKKHAKVFDEPTATPVETTTQSKVPTGSSESNTILPLQPTQKSARSIPSPSRPDDKLNEVGGKGSTSSPTTQKSLTSEPSTSKFPRVNGKNPLPEPATSSSLDEPTHMRDENSAPLTISHKNTISDPTKLKFEGHEKDKIERKPKSLLNPNSPQEQLSSKLKEGDQSDQKVRSKKKEKNLSNAIANENKMNSPLLACGTSELAKKAERLASTEEAFVPFDFHSENDFPDLSAVSNSNIKKAEISPKATQTKSTVALPKQDKFRGSEKSIFQSGQNSSPTAQSSETVRESPDGARKMMKKEQASQRCQPQSFNRQSFSEIQKLSQGFKSTKTGLQRGRIIQPYYQRKDNFSNFYAKTKQIYQAKAQKSELEDEFHKFDSSQVQSTDLEASEKIQEPEGNKRISDPNSPVNPAENIPESKSLRSQSEIEPKLSLKNHMNRREPSRLSSELSKPEEDKDTHEKDSESSSISQNNQRDIIKNSHKKPNEIVLSSRQSPAVKNLSKNPEDRNNQKIQGTTGVVQDNFLLENPAGYPLSKFSIVSKEERKVVHSSDKAKEAAAQEVKDLKKKKNYEETQSSRKELPFEPSTPENREASHQGSDRLYFISGSSQSDPDLEVLKKESTKPNSSASQIPGPVAVPKKPKGRKGRDIKSLTSQKSGQFSTMSPSGKPQELFLENKQFLGENAQKAQKTPSTFMSNQDSKNSIRPIVSDTANSKGGKKAAVDIKTKPEEKLNPSPKSVHSEKKQTKNDLTKPLDPRKPNDLQVESISDNKAEKSSRIPSSISGGIQAETKKNVLSYPENVFDHGHPSKEIQDEPNEKIGVKNLSLKSAQRIMTAQAEINPHQAGEENFVTNAPSTLSPDHSNAKDPSSQPKRPGLPSNIASAPSTLTAKSTANSHTFRYNDENAKNLGEKVLEMSLESALFTYKPIGDKRIFPPNPEPGTGAYEAAINIWGEKKVSEWYQNQLDFSLMGMLERELQVDRFDPHLKFRDALSIECYKKFKTVWELDKKQAIRALDFCKGLLPVTEGLRRLSALIKKLQKHSLAVNWQHINTPIDHRLPNPSWRHLSLKEFYGSNGANRRIDLSQYLNSRVNPNIWWDTKRLEKDSNLQGLDVLSIIKAGDALQFGSQYMLEGTGRMPFESACAQLITVMTDKSQLVQWFDSSERFWLQKTYGPLYMERLHVLGDLLRDVDIRKLSQDNILKTLLVKQQVRLKSKFELGDLLHGLDVGLDIRKASRLSRIKEHEEDYMSHWKKFLEKEELQLSETQEADLQAWFTWKRERANHQSSILEPLFKFADRQKMAWKTRFRPATDLSAFYDVRV